MNVIKLSPRGYCHGVINAINTVKNAILNEKKPIYILGAIIHNKHIVEYFSRLGAITIEDKTKTRLELLDSIKEGTVIFTAHGVSPFVYEKALKKGLKIIDASCRDVQKVHNHIEQFLNEGYKVFYIGQDNHPETEGVLGISPSIELIRCIDDIAKFPYYEKTYVTNQTTLSIHDTTIIFDALKKKYANIIVDNEICNATTKRQEALLNQKADLCFVVGDKMSSNTKKLCAVSNDIAKIKTIQIESVLDIDTSLLKDIYTVSVTSGASTPTSITNNVIAYLEQFDFHNPLTYSKENFLKNEY